MTDGLQIFSCPEFGSVRSLLIDGEPWFVAADLCRALEIDQVHKALNRLDADEVGRGIKIPHPQSPDKTLEVNVVNEPGMYTLVLGSRKPEAKAFKRWITHTILPALRRDGSYTMRQEEPLMLEEADDLPQRTVTPDDYLTAARILSTCRNERLPYALSCLRHAGIDLSEMLAANVPQQLKPKRTMWEKQRVSRLVRIALQDYGYTVRELARRLNVTPQCIVFYRDGERCPSPRHEFELVELLRQIIPVDELEARMEEDEAIVS